MKKFFVKQNKAFTLVETLVAIAIFSTSLLGLMSVLASSISGTTYAKQKMVADYLAQEGIETIRNMRDSFVLYSTNGQTGWTAFNTKLTGSSCQSASGCYYNIDNIFSISPPQPMTKISLAACGVSCATLLYDSSSGKYNYTSGVASGFVRKIQITQVSADDTRISSVVSWKQGSSNYNINFSEDLFNWVE